MDSVQRCLPAEIVLIIFENTNNALTLLSLIECYPTILPLPIKHRSRAIARGLFPQEWSKELCQYAYTCILYVPNALIPIYSFVYH